MLDNCTYNTIKLLNELSCIAWFLEKHAINDAHQAGNSECKKVLSELKEDISKQIDRLHKTLQ